MPVPSTHLRANHSGKPYHSNEPEGAIRLAATMCAEFLSILADNRERAIAPTNKHRRKDFEMISCPLVRHRLLSGLKFGAEEQSSDSVVSGIPNTDPYMSSLLVAYEIPWICLILWSDPALFVVSYEWIKLTVEEYHDDVCVGSLCTNEKCNLIPFDLLTFDSSSETANVNVKDYRWLVASILGSPAQEGMLTESVDRFGVQSSAIATLAATGLADN